MKSFSIHDIYDERVAIQIHSADDYDRFEQLSINELGQDVPPYYNNYCYYIDYDDGDWYYTSKQDAEDSGFKVVSLNQIKEANKVVNDYTLF